MRTISMKEKPPKWAEETVDIVYLAVIVIFNGWVALTQAAALAAPTAAISTAVLLMPRAENRYTTTTEQLYRLFGAIGMVLTAFLWLLSAIQPQTQILPTNPAHVMIVMFGWMMSVGMIVTSPILMVSGSNIDKAEDNRIKDYAIGIVVPSMFCGLMVFMLLLSEDIVGPAEINVLGIFVLFIVAMISGWFSVYIMRRRKQE